MLTCDTSIECVEPCIALVIGHVLYRKCHHISERCHLRYALALDAMDGLSSLLNFSFVSSNVKFSCDFAAYNCTFSSTQLTGGIVYWNALLDVECYFVYAMVKS